MEWKDAIAACPAFDVPGSFCHNLYSGFFIPLATSALAAFITCRRHAHTHKLQHHTIIKALTVHRVSAGIPNISKHYSVKL